MLMSKILNSHHAPLCPWHSPQKTEVAIELYMLQVNPLTSMRDWDRISPYCTISIHYQADKQGGDKGIISRCKPQILPTIITRIECETVRRITSEILGVKGLKWDWGWNDFKPHGRSICNFCCLRKLMIYLA